MTPSLKKRFWTKVTCEPSVDGYAIFLDQRQLNTPAKTPLIVPTQPLAKAIVAEWQAQTGEIDPRSMPVTRSANAALDKLVPQYDAVVDLLAEYGASDLLCYRAEEPAELAKRQTAAWDPVLDWAASKLQARLTVASGVIHTAQPSDSLDRLKGHLRGFPPFALTAVFDLVTLTGSLVLALAVAEKHLTAKHAWLLSRIDEQWQQERWGVDEDAAKAATAKFNDLLNAERFLTLARASVLTK